jgi:hypothetical protein
MCVFYQNKSQGEKNMAKITALSLALVACIATPSQSFAGSNANLENRLRAVETKLAKHIQLRNSDKIRALEERITKIEHVLVTK